MVSAIRICGNSSLRAFIGRAQEDPGTAERELLSCVSESTAEIFSDAGVSRITGKPKILEVVVDQGVSPPSLRALLLSADREDANDMADDLPNLSLNKGIKRRDRFWFILAAWAGVLLQTGIIVFAVLTVFLWPSVFLKNGSAVADYAFPFFVVGTVILTTGMFFCAFVIENSSTKYPLKLGPKSKVYWLQPGGQMVGDQTFQAFAGHTDEGVEYVRSVRFTSKSHRKSLGQDVSVLLIVASTMVGFVLQFIGLRGLHSSVTLAQLGSTMVMTVIRTSLRAQRMDKSENLLRPDQRLVARNRQELDWFTFCLLALESFGVCSDLSFTPATSRPSMIDESNDIPGIDFPVISENLAANAMKFREALFELGGSSWDKSSICATAKDLTRALEKTMTLVTSWSDTSLHRRVFLIPVDAKAKKSSEVSQSTKECVMSPSTDKRTWEMKPTLKHVLGLYVWSLIRQNPEAAFKKDHFRVCSFDKQNPTRSRLIYHRWFSLPMRPDSSRSLTYLNGCDTFGSESIETSNRSPHSEELEKTTSDLSMLAAQDIYVHFLWQMLDEIRFIGGTTEIVDVEFWAEGRNSRIDELAEVFSECGLGSHRDGLVCILPVLADRRLLPELSIGSSAMRVQLDELTGRGNWTNAFSLMDWLTALADPDDVERSLVEYGFFCVQGLMNPEIEKKSGLSMDRIIEFVRSDRLDLVQCLNTRDLHGIQFPENPEWWLKFRRQIGWMAWHIAQTDDKILKLLKHEIQKPSNSSFIWDELSGDHVGDDIGQGSLLDLWMVLFSGRQVPHELSQRAIDWLVLNGRDVILEWITMAWTANQDPIHSHDSTRDIIMYTAKRGYNLVVSFLVRHGLDKEDHRRGADSAMATLASEGAVSAVQMLLSCGTSDAVERWESITLHCAAEHGQVNVIELMVRQHCDVDVQDENGVTALMKAVTKGNFEATQLLLTHDANMEIQSAYSETALVIAVANRQTELVELLVNHGADVNAPGSDGMTPLTEAARKQNLRLLQFLLDHGADVHSRDKNGHTTMQLAMYAGLHGPWEEGCNFLRTLGCLTPN